MNWGGEIAFFFTALGISLALPIIIALRDLLWSGDWKFGSDEFHNHLEERIDNLHWLVWLGVATFAGIYVWRFIAGYNVFYR